MSEIVFKLYTDKNVHVKKCSTKGIVDVSKIDELWSHLRFWAGFIVLVDTDEEFIRWTAEDIHGKIFKECADLSVELDKHGRIRGI
ncbi:hypothetical protein [Mycobacterium camsae]|uniref:hypothetical protein n=1 Tax=Mycobacterium gordonae TaxID=1778 RepID=UPI00197FA913|nr:hypothetical protein [Mycobacterium gordonae]